MASSTGKPPSCRAPAPGREPVRSRRSCHISAARYWSWRARENVELVRSVCSAWGRGDYSSIEWAHPEIEFAIADGPSPGKWTGLAGMAEGWHHRSAGVFHVGVRKVTRFVAYLAKTASACSPTSGCRSSGGDCCQPLLVAAAALIRVIVPRGLYRDTLVSWRRVVPSSLTAESGWPCSFRWPAASGHLPALGSSASSGASDDRGSRCMPNRSA